MTLKCYRVDRSVLRRIFGHEQMDGSEVFLRDEKSLVVSILSSDYFIFGILGRCTPRTTKRSWWRWWRKWRKWTWKIMKNDHDGDDEPPCPENSLWELWGDACSWGNRLIDCMSFDFTVVVAKQSFWFLFRKMFAHCYFGRAGRPVLAIIFWYFSTRWCVKADKVASAATSSGWRITRTYNANCPVVAATYPSSWPLLHLLVWRKRVPHALRQFHKCSFHFSLIKAIFAPALYWCVLVRLRDQVQQRNQQCGLGGGGWGDGHIRATLVEAQAWNWLLWQWLAALFPLLTFDLRAVQLNLLVRKALVGDEGDNDDYWGWPAPDILGPAFWFLLVHTVFTIYILGPKQF